MASTDIRYEVRRSRRAKYMRLTVPAADQVVITVPHFMSVDMVRDFLAQKAGWISRAIDTMRRRPQREAIGNGRAGYIAMKEQAREVIAPRVDYFARALKVSVGRVSIRNQKSCWGSCSRRGNVNFNYRLVHLDEALRDYIIVHELCHLKELNHSARFWGHVASQCPEYKLLRKKLHGYEIR